MSGEALWELNRRILKHEAETDMRDHDADGRCCLLARLTPIDDDSRPHKFPTPVPDGEVIAWKCAACGEWIREYEYSKRGPCPVDWRHA